MSEPTSPPGLQTQPRVACIVLNWNGWRDTLACLESLSRQTAAGLSVVVVDNRSTDDSVEQIRRAFPSVELVQAELNAGFAAGCNLGIEAAARHRPEYVWLLNNDTVVPPDTLALLLEAAGAAGPSTGMIGSVLRFAGQPGRIQSWGGGHVSRLTGRSRHLTAPAALGPGSYLTFASVLLRRELLDGIGLLDEGFFMYYEDADLCFRAHDAGWTLAVADRTAILHKEGASTTPGRALRRARVVTASGLRFSERHGRPRAVAIGLYLLLRIANRLVRGRWAEIRAVLQGVGDWRRQRRDAPDPVATAHAQTGSLRGAP